MKTITLISLAGLAAILSSCTSSDVNVAIGAEALPYQTTSKAEQFADTEDRDPELANADATDPIWYWTPGE